MYTSFLPCLSLVGIVGIAVQYWVDKKFLLRWAKLPSNPMTARPAVGSLQFVRVVGAFALPVGAFTFIHPSWEKPEECAQWFIISIAIAGERCFTVRELRLDHRDHLMHSRDHYRKTDTTIG